MAVLWEKQGDDGLVHRSRGRLSNRAIKSDVKDKAIKLYVEKYIGFGPTLASEKLEEEDGLQINPETLRLWLKKEGLWSRVQNAHRPQLRPSDRGFNRR